MSLITSTNSMQNILLNLFGDKYKDYITLALNWKRIVGSYLSKYSEIVKIDKNIIFIGVSNSAVMQELVLMREHLQNKIADILHLKIEDIVFFVVEPKSYGTKEQIDH